MNDFLEQVWWGNPVKNYFITGGIILFVWLLKKFISRYFAGLLFRVVHSIWKDVDKKSFINLVVKPLGFFLLILVSIVTLYKLNFPEELNPTIYKYTVKEIIHCFGTIILIVSFIFTLVSIFYEFIFAILAKVNLY